MKQKIMRANGSVQEIPEIPENIKELYKTVWEISQKTIIDMAADRGAYICQSQSLNIHMQNPNFAKLTSMHFHAWKKGLKTGMYYLRTKSATDAIKFTLQNERKAVGVSQTVEGNQGSMTEAQIREQNQADMACSLDNPDECEACGKLKIHSCCN